MSVRDLGNPLGNPLALARAKAGDLGESRGEVTFTVPGTHQWKVPKNVRSVCAVVVSRGGYASGTGGGGGGLAWKNNIPVTPGEIITIKVGSGEVPSASSDPNGDSWFISESVVCASGASGATGGKFVAGDGGGDGGDAIAGGGGGAGGYTGNGGNGGAAGSRGGAGSGGAAAGGQTASNGNGKFGGGVGLFGQGANGSPIPDSATGGSGGQGTPGIATAQKAPLFGGGGKAFGTTPYAGGDGAVRILWGKGRAFPSTDVGPS